MKPLSWLTRLRRASSRAAQADTSPWDRSHGVAPDWAPTSYLEYYARSPVLYAAVNIRAQAIARAPLAIFQGQGQLKRQVAHDHPLQRLFDRPNPDFTGRELMAATETFLSLAGRAYWSIEIRNGQVELWPLRPDRLYVVAGSGPQHIKGYRYQGLYGDVAYLPEEVVTFTRFNPLQDRTGLSPIASLRMTLDMGIEAMKYNRDIFKNGIPDFLFATINPIAEPQYESFRTRWKSRFGLRGETRVPAIADNIASVHPLAFSQREMEYNQTLQWVVEEVARVQGVPQPLLASLRQATLANVQSLERIFWRITMIPECEVITAKIQQDALPKLGWPELTVECDFGGIDVLTEEEGPRLKRETEYMDRGAMTINEVRLSRGMEPIPGGDDPDAPSRRARPAFPGQAPTREASADSPFQPHEAHSGSHPSNGHYPSQAHR